MVHFSPSISLLTHHLDYILDHFRIQEQIRRAGLSNDDLEPAENDPEYNPDDEQTRKGEKRKHFDELGPEMKKLRMKPLQKHVEVWSKENKVDVDDTITRLGMNHANAELDKNKAKIYKQILDGQNPYKNQELTVPQAVALKVICSLFTCRSAVCLQFIF